MDEQFEVGDFVFAKLKGHPHWPATISQIETIHASGVERTKYNVYFYGSHQMSLIKVDQIVKFDDHYDFLKKRYASNTKFLAALEELEADLETRKSYLQSLRECLIESVTHDIQDEPEDEMFSASEESCHEPVVALCDRLHGTQVSSSGFSEGYESDEENKELSGQKFEIISMEKVLFPGTADMFLIISLGFNERNLQEDFEYIKNEVRMMQCYVKLERLPNNLIKISGQKRSKKERIQVTSPILGKVDHNPNSDSVEVHGKAVVGTNEALTENSEPVVKRRRGRKKKRDNEVELAFGKRRKGKHKKLKNSFWNNGTSFTIIAAEAVKRRRQRRKKHAVCDETRLTSLRERQTVADPDNTNFTCECSCPPEQCDCKEETEPEIPTAIVCPICKAQFSSSVDFKQHSFNIHIMGL